VSEICGGRTEGSDYLSAFKYQEKSVVSESSMRRHEEAFATAGGGKKVVKLSPCIEAWIRELW
jgi:hypothetical protein